MKKGQNYRRNRRRKRRGKREKDEVKKRNRTVKGEK